MRKRVIGAVCVVLLLAATGFASGPQQPGVGGDQQTYNCAECEITENHEGVCYWDVPGAAWADCAGGQYCYWDGALGWKCEPYCGKNRCLYI